MLRQLLTEYVMKTIPKGSQVALLYSGGFESFSCLHTLLDLGFKPHLYTFALQGVVSHAVKKSQADAQLYGLPFTLVEVPDDLQQLKTDVLTLIRKLGTYRKTAIQCCHPIMYACKAIKEHYVVAGLENGIWGFAMKSHLVYRDEGQEGFDRFRREKLADETTSIHYIQQLIFENHVGCFPFLDKAVEDYFMGLSYEELKNKKPIKDAFAAEIAGAGVQQAHFQVESGVREFHDKLLQDPTLNPGGKVKSVVSLYRIMDKMSKGNHFQL